jgi:hypothetical protein
MPAFQTTLYQLQVQNRYSAVPDQTKESNDSSKGLKSEHKDQLKKENNSAGSDHPAKQPDPQASPSKSTGVREEGPGSKAGEGKDEGVTKDDKVRGWAG